MLISNRLPHEYFITTGKGESNAGSKGLPFETGSYDDALNDAGIENANIMVYTSVMPTHIKEIEKSKALKTIKWGQVLECIMAKHNGRKGEKIAAAVMINSVYDKNNKYLGGYATEYAGGGTEDDAKKSLLESVKGMMERRGLGKLPENTKFGEDNKTDKGYIIHPGKIFAYDSINVKKQAGTVLASICFLSFKVETLHKSILNKTNKTRKRKIN